MSFGLYDGGDAKCDPDFGTSKKLAGVGRDALILAATVGAGGSAVAAEETGGVVEGATEGSEDIAETCLRCFTGETLVQMADGTAKPIRDVQVGDRVKSRDPVTGKESAKTVTATIQRLASSVVRVSVTDAKTAGPVGDADLHAGASAVRARAGLGGSGQPGHREPDCLAGRACLDRAERDVAAGSDCGERRRQHGGRQALHGLQPDSRR